MPIGSHMHRTCAAAISVAPFAVSAPPILPGFPTPRIPQTSSSIVYLFARLFHNEPHRPSSATPNLISEMPMIRKRASMKISTKTRYGMRLMIDIAQNQCDGRVALKDAAERQGISKKYLEQVVAPLVSTGLLTVTRGPQGGYRLTREAQDITLADIVSASEDGLELLACVFDDEACERSCDCASRHIWGGLQDAVRSYLENQTLADVALRTPSTRPA